jgi:hypothetical protein
MAHSFLLAVEVESQSDKQSIGDLQGMLMTAVWREGLVSDLA